MFLQGTARQQLAKNITKQLPYSLACRLLALLRYFRFSGIVNMGILYMYMLSGKTVNGAMQALECLKEAKFYDEQVRTISESQP